MVAAWLGTWNISDDEQEICHFSLEQLLNVAWREDIDLALCGDAFGRVIIVRRLEVGDVGLLALGRGRICDVV